MLSNQINAYDVEPHVAEIYDQLETGSDDVKLLQQLIENRGPLTIFEPFFGTGRISIPLVRAGHTIVGLDQAAGMLARASARIKQLPLEMQKRITLQQADVFSADWPTGFDLVILGCNCFYELATATAQEKCVEMAFQALKAGGHVFIDNDHMEGELDVAWQDIGIVQPGLNGQCADGTLVESTRETIWFDVAQRLARFRRRTKVTLPHGELVEQEYIQQKHPVSQVEVQAWLKQHHFAIEGLFGDYTKTPYHPNTSRAIFWAKRS